MKLLALLEEVSKAAGSGDSTANSHITLAQKVIDLADMVGWAEGPIDPEGRFAGRFMSVMELLQERHARTGEPSVAALHEALVELHEKIDRHDRDLVIQRDKDDDYEE